MRKQNSLAPLTALGSRLAKLVTSKNGLLVGLFLVTVLMAACGSEATRTADQLRHEVHEAEKTAELSAGKPDATAAQEAAARATKALKQLRKMQTRVNKGAEAEPIDLLIRETEASANQAVHWAGLAAEKVAKSKKLNGWKAKSYYLVTDATLKLTCKGLALAADQGAAGNLAVLPQKVQDAANEAAKIVEALVGPQRLPDTGAVDWLGVSRELTTLADAPPVEFQLLSVTVMLLMTEFDFAFFDIEALDQSKLNTVEMQVWYHVLRGMTHFSQGYGKLAMIEIDEAQLLSGNMKLKAEEQCGLQLIFAMLFLHEQRFSDADRAIVAANRAWPNNPLAVYLTGERQIASGEYAAATESLQKVAAGTEFAWLAERVAERTKQMRDHPNELSPVIFDAGMISELIWEFVKSQASKSDAMKNLQSKLEAAKTLVQDFKKKLPELPDVEDELNKFKEWIPKSK